MKSSQDSGAFLEQTRGALTYYVRLLSEQRLFDRLYVIGWQPLLKIGPYREGGRDQNNPALLPELYAALAALQYFATEDGPVDGEPVRYFTTDNTTSIDWNDLPPLRGGGQHDVRRRLGELIRFANAYHSIYRPALRREHRRAVEREAWFRRLVGSNSAVLADQAEQDFLDLMDDYSVELLRWAAALVFSAANSAELKLYQAGQFARAIEADERFERAELRPGVDRRVFGSLIEGEDGPDLPAIFDRLTYDPRPEGREGLGMFLRALHEACEHRHQDAR